MNWLPEEYEAPKSTSGYMKLQEGENRIRILSQPIYGWEDWTADKKPVRSRYDNKPLKSIDPKRPVKHFWAFIVWNYNEEQIQILQVSQATIRKNLEKLCKDADWGAPTFYDIKITKEGEAKDTEYTVNPVSHKPVSPAIIEAFKEKPCNLEALFDNADPFSKEWDTFTPGIFRLEDSLPEQSLSPKKLCIKKEQAAELESILVKCNPAYTKSVWEMLHNNNIIALQDLPIEMYDRLKKAATKKAEEYQQSNADWILEDAQ